MNIPISDNRYFTLSADDVATQSIPLYHLHQYVVAYSQTIATLPELFSINLKYEIEDFITKAPPQFVSDIAQVIDLACYYYNDWESVVAITDEFIQTEVLNKVCESLKATYGDNTKLVQEKLDDTIAQLATALTEFINIIISVLTRAGIPVIHDYGSSYRLDNIDDFGNVYFRIRTPAQVHAELAGDPVP